MSINKTNNQKGAASIITVLALVMLFTILSLSYLRLAVRDSRQSIDTDLNLKALYAAESGLEDAKAYLLSGGSITALDGTDCSPLGQSSQSELVLDADLDVSVSCQLINRAPGDFIADVTQNQSVFFPLTPTSNDPTEVNSVTIEWHSFTENGTSVNSRNSISIPTVGEWNNAAAMMRVGLFTHSATGAVNRNSLESGNKVVFTNPSPGSGAIDAASLKSVSLENYATCNGVSGTDIYYCSMTINNLTEANYLRLTPLYRDTQVKVSISGAGGPLKLKDVQAEIDVTGQANDVLRRIVARVPLRAYDVLPDHAISTTDELCKIVEIAGSGNVARDACLDLPSTASNPTYPFGGFPGGGVLGNTNNNGGTPGNANAGECPPADPNCVWDPVRGEWVWRGLPSSGLSYRWGQSFYNNSNTVPTPGLAPMSDVTGCLWEWGDGTSNYYLPNERPSANTDPCNTDGGRASHPYPDLQASIEANIDPSTGLANPGAGCRQYHGRLTVYFTAASGRPNKSDNFRAYIPGGDAARPGGACYRNHRDVVGVW